jgi:hypothetical protein
VRLPQEPEIEAQQEQDEVDEGSAGADCRRLDKVRAEQGHGNIREVEIEEDARRNEEGAREELPEVTAAPSQIEAPSPWRAE